MMSFGKKTVPLLVVVAVVCYAILLPVLGFAASARANEPASADIQVVTSQAGFSKEDLKLGSVVSDRYLESSSFEVLQQDAPTGYSGALTYEGKTWGKHVYTFDFSSLRMTGQSFTVTSNGAVSYPFSIKENIWMDYRDEMTAYYRILRSGVDIVDVLPPGYTDTPLSPEAYHAAGHLDDGWDRDGVFPLWGITLEDGTQPAKGQHYDLTGGHYDAGDYGKYAGNQWVGGQLALAYLRHSDSPAVQFDYDVNGVPDIIEEARVNAEYTLKFVDHFDGALFDIPRKGGFQHPVYETDGIPLSPAGNPDDREIGQLSVGGSAKAAGMMAATARAYSVWKEAGQIEDPEVQDFISRATAGAMTAYSFAYGNQDKNEGSGYTTNDLSNPLLWAEVELYLLTNDMQYFERASQRIAGLEANQVRQTNYWDVRPMAMAEFYPAADSSTQAKIKQLLKARVDYFLSSSDDTPYGVIHEFSNFGVNEPHMSLVGDIIRYYELFGDPEVLTAAKKGLYWVFGNNPWNISWVSGIGAHHVRYPHSRFDQDAYSGTNEGIVHTGAMVAGPTSKDPAVRTGDTSPWYEDRSLAQDGTAQWRYNEHSISIQAGLFYSIMALSALNEPSSLVSDIPRMPVLSPQTGDYVTGDVNLLVALENGVASVQAAGSSMQPKDGVWTSTLNVDGYRPYDARRITAVGQMDSGRTIYSSAHYTVAPPLPSPGAPLMFDDFDKNGVFGFQSLGWQNWYTQDGRKDGAYAKETIDGRTVGRFTHTPSTANAQAKFQPWHYKADWSGYRYLYITLKNTGRHPDLLFKAQVNGKDLNGGYAKVPGDWTTLKIDLDLIAGLNKEQAALALWLKGGTVAGDILIDDIFVGNDAAGSAPVLTDTAVHTDSGDERTVFHFSVTYTDADNNRPYTVQLITDGVIHEMMETDATDQDMTDGKQYGFSTSLVRGPHQYYVRTTDTTSDTVQSPVQTGLVVSASHEPYGRPTAPRNLRLVSKTDSSAVLDWQPSEDGRGVSEYGIYADGILIGTVQPDQRSYEAVGLEAGRTYRFDVRGRSVMLQPSDASNTVLVRTKESNTYPARFFGQYADTANERKAANEWPASPNGFGKAWRGGSISWTVDFPAERAYDFTLRALGEGSGVSLQVIVDGQAVPNANWGLTGKWADYTGNLGRLSAGAHTIQVKNVSAASANVDIAHMDIVGALPDRFGLTSPEDQSTAESTEVWLNWMQSVTWRDRVIPYAPMGADQYKLVVADDTEFANPIFETTVTEAIYQVSGLAPGTRYYWKVYAGNGNGWMPSEKTFSFMTPERRDDLAPVTTAVLQGDKFGDWYRSDVTLRLTAADEGSGVARTEYRLQGEAGWTLYEDAVVIPSEGFQLIEYRSTDHAGNVEESQVLTVAIDKTAPCWSITDRGLPISNGVVFLDMDTHAFELVPSDTHSGVGEALLILDGVPYEPGRIIDFEGRLGDHRLTVTVVDQAGNRTEAEWSFRVNTSIESVEAIYTRFVESGYVSGPMVPKLGNSIRQTKHHLEKGDREKAAMYMEHFVKQLANPPMDEHLSDVAKAVLTTDADALTKTWNAAE